MPRYISVLYALPYLAVKSYKVMRRRISIAAAIISAVVLCAAQCAYIMDTEIAGVYDSYVSKTEGLFAQYESQFNERYSSFESTLDNWDKELLSAYTEFMAKIKLFQSDAENEFNTWFESIKDKLGEDIAGSLQLQIEELAAAMQEVKKQAEAGTKETKEAIAALDERLKRVESGWGIDYKHDAVLGLCYMGAAYMSQHYERTVESLQCS